jgi:cobalamin biosynthesis protein CobW
MSELSRVPCTVVTGFLGAGKTTLIRHVLQNAGGRRFAVIVNEFGDVGIDVEILRSCGVEGCSDESIVELANGCICCTVADDFVPALDRILGLEPRVDHIVIETSGLALPKPLVQAFQWPGVRSRVTVDSVVAVVDGLALAEGRVASDMAALAAQRGADPALEHDDPVEEVFGDQVACADLVVLTKGDLLDAGALAAAEAAGVLRVKGFAEVAGKPMRLLVQGVGTRVVSSYDRAWGPGEARGTRLVVIGLKGLDRGVVEGILAGPVAVG